MISSQQYDITSVPLSLDEDLKMLADYASDAHEMVRDLYPRILLDDAGRTAYVRDDTRRG